MHTSVEVVVLVANKDFGKTYNISLRRISERIIAFRAERELACRLIQALAPTQSRREGNTMLVELGMPQG